MTEKREYIRDIVQMRTMMERSSKFMSLSGLACVMAGVYALSGAWIAYKFFYFNPGEIVYNSVSSESLFSSLSKVIFLAVVILLLAIGTAIYLSCKKAARSGEKSWNPTVRRLLVNMSVPLVAGGILILILISNGFIGFLAPFSLLFYGMALFNASRFTFAELRSLGLIEIGLGLTSAYFVGYGLLLWALGFGVVHIVYGIYLHYKYER